MMSGNSKIQHIYHYIQNLADRNTCWYTYNLICRYQSRIYIFTLYCYLSKLRTNKAYRNNMSSHKSRTDSKTIFITNPMMLIILVAECSINTICCRSGNGKGNNQEINRRTMGAKITNDQRSVWKHVWREWNNKGWYDEKDRGNKSQSHNDHLNTLGWSSGDMYNLFII